MGRGSRETWTSEHQVHGRCHSCIWLQTKLWLCLRNLVYLPRAELESRVEVEYETYAKAINIEAKAMIDIAGKQIIPAVIKYTNLTCNTP